VTSTGGKLIAFESNADPTGVGEHTTQVYTYAAKTASFAQLSHGPGAGRNPSLSLNGGLVAFESETDLLENGTAGTQIFVHKRTRALLQQISSHPIGHSTGASMSANGHAVSFISSDDLLGSGSIGPEVFSYHLRQRVLRQITDSPSTASTAAYAAGVFITFLSDGDPLGTNPNSFALFLVNLFALGAQTLP
jgi:Tol biopolymer transport system component